VTIGFPTSRPLLRVGLLAVLCLVPYRHAIADETANLVPRGTHELSLMAGPALPVRVLDMQTTKLFGVGLIPSWAVTLTDPIGPRWIRGQVAIGVELLSFRMDEPIVAYGVGLTPKLRYTFTVWDRLRPYVDGGGGPVWTDLGGRVPEQPGQFNFVVWGGVGFSWPATPFWSVNAGARFYHISNAGTRQPNSGLNFWLPFVGITRTFF
jgi:hypothetical protein